MKVITSPIVASSESATFSTIKLTTGVTLTSAVVFTTVAFSLQVTLTTLVKVPLVNALRVIANTYDSPALITGIVNKPVLLS